MTIVELFAEVRDLYTMEFSSTLARYPGAASEAAYRTANGDLAREGSLELPARLDILPRSGEASGKPIMVDSPGRIAFEPIQIQWSERLSVQLGPFIWDYARLHIQEFEASSLQAGLSNWFMRWFDSDDENIKDASGLYNVVHFVSDPNTVERGVEVIVDLGSAPPEALVNLLDELESLGVESIQIS